MGRYTYDIETPGGRPIGTANTIKAARAIAKDYVEKTGKPVVILREGRHGSVTHVEDWTA